jgi:hypothetical protein
VFPDFFGSNLTNSTTGHRSRCSAFSSFAHFAFTPKEIELCNHACRIPLIVFWRPLKLRRVNRTEQIKSKQNKKEKDFSLREK